MRSGLRSVVLASWQMYPYGGLGEAVKVVEEIVRGTDIRLRAALLRAELVDAVNKPMESGCVVEELL